MSRADAAARILEAAMRLGSASGVSALSVQGVAGAAGVSKALVLYHFDTKAALLSALVEALGARSAARLHEAAGARAVETAWRALVVEECRSRELTLLAALSLEPDVAGTRVEAVAARRTEAASVLGTTLLATFGLAPRIPVAFLARVLLRELDALVLATARTAPSAETLDAEQDAMLLAFLALGR